MNAYMYVLICTAQTSVEKEALQECTSTYVSYVLFLSLPHAKLFQPFQIQVTQIQDANI